LDKNVCTLSEGEAFATFKLHSLTLDESFFHVKSAGLVSQGSETMKAGDGSNTVGGANGNFFIFGGQGSGGKLRPFHLYFQRLMYISVISCQSKEVKNTNQ